MGSNGTSGNVGNGSHMFAGVRAPISAQSSSSSVYNNKVSSQANLPVVYAPHSSPVPISQQVHQFPCKYPGCNQVGGANIMSWGGEGVWQGVELELLSLLQAEMCAGKPSCNGFSRR